MEEHDYIRIKNLMSQYNIPLDSEVGRMFVKLDSLYNDLDGNKKQILNLKLNCKQLAEDIQLLETMIMYKFNKDTRGQRI